MGVKHFNLKNFCKAVEIMKKRDHIKLKELK